jgi:hypothetical protein
MRAVLGFVCAGTLSGLLSACGSQGYSAQNELSTDLLFAPQTNSPYTYAIGNTGKLVQQLVLRVDTHGTLAIQSLTAVMGIDPELTKVDFSQGPVYLPPHPVRPQLMEHTGTRWVWNLGDLPSGYHAVAWLKARKLKAIPRRGHIVDLMWYALTSPDQPRRTWQQLVGIYGQS